jgi:cycloeucalenol cycloisomerase
MYTVGSLFYAIYFFVSYPAFFLMDEDPYAPKLPAWRAAWDALASGMLVTIILDFWRLGIGPIVTHETEASVAAHGLPFLEAS